ncbi:uncharacterized protein LOC126609198 [Malus sylvestris]|uniref:uncharacterized protein LOC126609198 n=1 Tax=Malus sylvestris TaxID=3752 RepID=UPI0021AC67E8|nr:uncharacterized protein LOC126609198 [Malus sylvestris]
MDSNKDRHATKFGANSRENSGKILPFTAKSFGADATRETFPQFFCEGTRDLLGRFQASLSKKAFDVRSIPGSRGSTNSRPWRSGLLELPLQPTLALLPRAIRPCSTHGPSSNSSRWSCSKCVLKSKNILKIGLHALHVICFSAFT